MSSTPIRIDCPITERSYAGRPTLYIEYPTKGRSRAHDLNLSMLNDLPGLREPLSRALMLHGTSVASPKTRIRVAGNLGSGFLKFLREADQASVGPAQIDKAMISRFVLWLDRPGESKTDGLSVRAKQAYLRDLRLVLSAARRDPALASSFPTFSFPVNPWRGDASAAPPQPRIEAEGARRLLRQCEAEVAALVTRLEPYLTHFDDRSSPSPSPATEFVAGRLTGIQSLREIDHLLSKAGAGQDSDLYRALRPSVADLIPIIIPLAFLTLFNTSTLLKIRHEDVRRVSFLGVERVVLTSYKPRSGTMQTKSFPVTDEILNPAVLTSFVARWTAALRRINGSDCLFVVANRDSIFDLGSRHEVAHTTWTIPLREYLERNGVPHLAINDVRKGVLDMIDVLTGGDVDSLHEAAGGTSIDVILNRYRTVGGGQRDAQRLASAMQQRDRWLRSDARIDPRGVSEVEDARAATPGWTCLDPYASPIPGQQDGRLCDAYGMCPACPLASLDLQSPRSCALAHQLLETIERSFSIDDAMSAGAFVGRWRPVAARLATFWLKGFSPEVRKAASGYPRTRMPEVE